MRLSYAFAFALLIAVSLYSSAAFTLPLTLPHGTNSSNNIREVQWVCPRGFYINNAGQCVRLPRGNECKPGYFLDADGRCKRTQKNLILIE